MNKVLYWSSIMIYYIDGHFDKMNRYNGFKLPSNLYQQSEGMKAQLSSEN